MTRIYQIDVLDQGEWRPFLGVKGYFADVTQLALAAPFQAVQVSSATRLVYQHHRKSDLLPMSLADRGELEQAEAHERETIPAPDPEDWAAALPLRLSELTPQEPALTPFDRFWRDAATASARDAAEQQAIAWATAPMPSRYPL